MAARAVVCVNQALYDVLQAHAPEHVKTGVQVIGQDSKGLHEGRLKRYAFDLMNSARSEPSSPGLQDMRVLKEKIKLAAKKGFISINDATEMSSDYRVERLNSEEVITLYAKMISTYFVDETAKLDGDLITGILKTAFLLRASPSKDWCGAPLKDDKYNKDDWDLVVSHEKGEHSCHITMLRIGTVIGSTRNFLFFTLGRRLVSVDFVGYTVSGRSGSWLSRVQ